MPGALRLGGFELYRLRGGEFRLDGGAMFGPVPKALWSKVAEADPENRVLMYNSPLLIKTPGALVLVDTGLGNKLTAKQKRIFGVSGEWNLPGELDSLGMGRKDITHVVLTHCDFDHSGGVIMDAGDGDGEGNLELTFPRALHIVQSAEWKDVSHPTKRQAESYWPVNFSGLEESGRLMLVEGDYEVTDGVRLLHTGGHTGGHQAVVVESGGEAAIHMADLLPTHMHFNPLWITAYDNYPLEAIKAKEELEAAFVARGAWFTFYHDPVYAACKFDEKGTVIASWA